MNHLQFSNAPHGVLREVGIAGELMRPLPVFLGRAIPRAD